MPRVAMFSETSPHLTTRMVACVMFALTAPVLLFVKFQPFAPPHTMLRDPLAVAQWAKTECCAAYFGFVSLLGSALWAAAAAVALLAWLFLRRLDRRHSRLSFFFLAFVVSSALFLDDTFMLHESVLPRYGIGEKLVYLVLLAPTLLYLASGRFLLQRRSGLMLVLSLALLGASALADVATHTSYIVEDGLKFFGIVVWTVFHVSIVLEELHLAFGKAHPRPGPLAPVAAA